MNRSATVMLIAAGIVSAIALPHFGHTQTTYNGTVGRVWEDGFRLHTGDRTLWVDARDLYGDNTPGNIAVGDRITVTGEFERIEFDALSITDADPQLKAKKNVDAPE